MWRSARSVSSVVVAACPGTLDLGVEDVVHVLAQRHDGRREVALVGGVAEGRERRGARSPARHPWPSSSSRGAWILDGLEVEQLDAGHLDDVGRDVARQAEVDDELAHLRGLGCRRTRQCGDGCPELLAPDGDERPVDTTWCSEVVQVTMMSTLAATAA